ncbi:hypothetical protein [Streptomyces natalensis]|uniref:Uncharacterized protein n=1 Tax=Streptomyces natalensis ATCC 27448 TaxID=1240678 RepID=A0A0D7CVD5_9ACTN|nr:hypothetical protein [Streptomyces natalensis]KIZ19790.1 hypothetical protein SNA_00985 [Streptomyces natalensis ATCC 27448]
MTRRLVRAFLALLLPGYGRHRAPAVPQPAPAPPPRRNRLPRHKSPYAHDAACGGLFMDTPRLVPSYVPAPYISPACHIGTHAACDKGAAEPEVVAAPGVRWEICCCACHVGGDAEARHHPAGSFVSVLNTVPSGAAA